MEKNTPIELRIYPGADGDFMVYEDEEDSCCYEKGAYSFIPLKWNDKSRTLTLGERKGSFPGMPAQHTFHVLLVKPKQGIGIESETKLGIQVSYSGKAVVLKL